MKSGNAAKRKLSTEIIETVILVNDIAHFVTQDNTAIVVAADAGGDNNLDVQMMEVDIVGSFA